MADIQHPLALLRSDNHNDRYDACEQLRVWQEPLPEEAINALGLASNDSNLDVADAARRALSLHSIDQSNKKLERDISKIIAIEDGMLERQGDTGIINISYSRRELLFPLVAHATLAAAIFLSAFGLVEYFSDERFLFLLLVSAYFAYLAYRRFLGTQKNGMEINPQTRLVKIKGKAQRQVLFTDIQSVSARQGEGIVLAGMAMADIVITLKSGEKIVIASLLEDEIRIADKAEDISDMVANTIGLRREQEETNSV